MKKTLTQFEKRIILSVFDIWRKENIQKSWCRFELAAFLKTDLIQRIILNSAYVKLKICSICVQKQGPNVCNQMSTNYKTISTLARVGI